MYFIRNTAVALELASNGHHEHSSLSYAKIKLVVYHSHLSLDLPSFFIAIFLLRWRKQPLNVKAPWTGKSFIVSPRVREMIVALLQGLKKGTFLIIWYFFFFFFSSSLIHVYLDYRDRKVRRRHWPLFVMKHKYLFLIAVYIVIDIYLWLFDATIFYWLFIASTCMLYVTKT